MTKQLTGEQLGELAQFERFFHQAVEARYCSYPGAAAVDKILSIWNDMTGQARRVCAGCPEAIFHLITDMGTVYFAQKDAAEKAVCLPATAVKAQKASKPTPAKRKAVKAKK